MLLRIARLAVSLVRDELLRTSVDLPVDLIVTCHSAEEHDDFRAARLIPDGYSEWCFTFRPLVERSPWNFVLQI